MSEPNGRQDPSTASHPRLRVPRIPHAERLLATPLLARLRGLRRPGRPSDRVLGVGIIVVALLATQVGLTPDAAPLPSGIAEASPTAGVTPGAGGSASPDWQGLADLPPIPDPVADLVPTAADAAGVATGTAFTLRSRTSVPAAELAAGLTASPPIALRVAPTSDPSAVTITPAAALTAGTTYRFDLTGSDGALAGAWAFRAKTPLHVVESSPADQATGVPLDAGIELVFDQSGATDPGSHLSISPATDGRVETRGRSVVFIPAAPLKPGTVYTVTLTAGVAVAGSDVRLESDVRLAFETNDRMPDGMPGDFVVMGRPIIETPTTEAPIVAIYRGWRTPDRPLPTTLRVEVYRLPDAASALAAATAVLSTPVWARFDTSTLYPTSGLTRVAAFDGTVEPVDSMTEVVRFPAALPRGDYLIVLPAGTGVPRAVQGILQVTDLSSYTLVTSTDLLVWANGIGGGPMAGVTVSGAGRELGRTGADGLLRVPTPASLQDPSAPALLTLTGTDGEKVLVPLGMGDRVTGYLPDLRGWWGWYGSRDDAWWSILTLDRTTYRTNDTVRLWGYLRSRDTGTSPARVQLRISPYHWEGEAETFPIATIDVTPNADGAFTAAIPIADAPMTSYVVEALVDGSVVATTSMTVDVVRKPTFQMSLDLDRTVVVTGTPVTATIHVSFFDGTPAPGLEVALSGGRGFDGKRATTDAQGTVVVKATVSQEPAEWSRHDCTMAWVDVRTTGDQEGLSSATHQLLICPSTLWTDADATLAGSTFTATGSVVALDLGAMERSFADTYDTGHPGTPVAGVKVAGTLTEQWATTTVTGHVYDYIEKRVIDTYDYVQHEQVVGTLSAVTDAAGRFTITKAVADPTHTYRADLTVTDGAGLAMERDASAATPAGQAWAYAERPTLQPTCAPCPQDDGLAIGETLTVTLSDGHGAYPTDPGRYLFATTQRGLRSVAIGDGPTYTHAFTAADAPNLSVLGVRFTGRLYLSATTTAGFDRTTRQADVRLSTDQARYRPGDLVTVRIHVADPSGTGLAATVTVKGVDEKLYAGGYAFDTDPLWELYAWVGDGILASHASHPLPWGMDGGGMGADGGGRQDFVDTVVYRQVATDASGDATLQFRASDDLTSWRLTADAVARGTDLPWLGQAKLLVPVGLPFFVESSIAPELLLGDRPAVAITAYGADLKAGEPVEFTVTAPTLGLAPTRVSGTAFVPTRVTLPSLALGQHRVTIAGSAHAGALTDAVIRSTTVVKTRLSALRSAHGVLEAGPAPAGGGDLTTFTISDAGRGRYLWALEGVALAGGARFDDVLAAAVARGVLAREFGRDAATFPELPDPASYQRGDTGIAPVPWASGSLELAAWAAILAPDAFDTAALENEMATILGLGSATVTKGGTSSETRERRLMALAAAAALGTATLADVQGAAADTTRFETREKLYLAIAATRVGDLTLAARLEREVLAAEGQSYGSLVRLSSGEVATSLWAYVAVQVGDPVAARAAEYLQTRPKREEATSLQAIGYLIEAMRRTPSGAARFAYTVNGTRTVVDLDPGDARTLVLTEAQRATLTFEPLAGTLSWTATWSGPVDPAAAPTDPDVHVSRTISPASPVGVGEAILVTIRVTWPTTEAWNGNGVGIDVVDVVPSGLVAMSYPVPASSDGLSIPGDARVRPDSILGQQVRFSFRTDYPWFTGSATLVYWARRVAPGSYAWEPTIAQTWRDRERMASTAAETIVLE